MNKVALLIREENTKKENEYYLNAIYKYNKEPVLIYDNEEKEDVLSKLNKINYIILPGGNDVGKLDFFIIEHAIKFNKRLLGICQGMQSMALYDSNNILKEVKEDNHYNNYHQVMIKSSKVKKLLQKSVIEVNSYHHQKITESIHFNIVGYSTDNIIELIEHPTNDFQLGVQWHPERMIDSEISNLIFKEFYKKNYLSS